MGYQFKPGDIVRLRSGSPDMLVQYTVNGGGDGPQARLIWFDGLEVKETTVYCMLLDLISEPQQDRFKPGAMVRFKSGSPDLIIKHVTGNSSGSLMVAVYWFNGDNVQSYYVADSLLEPVSSLAQPDSG